ncbi:MAG: methyl-accepting chemotaxis protein [Clostridia bacterium]|nr:methyl-accepting chemotaxis protein [Clostridia bacterium]
MFNTLMKKILSAMLLLTSICTILFSVVSYYEVQKSVMSQMKNDGATLVTSIRREIKKYEIRDLNQIQDVFQEVKNESDGNIVYISLSDSNGKILISDSNKAPKEMGNIGAPEGERSGESNVDAVSAATKGENATAAVSKIKISGQVLTTSSGEAVYSVSAPFAYNTSLTGTLNIGISLRVMHDEIRHTLIEILAIALVILLFTVLIGLLISRSLVKPVNDIMYKLNDFSKGDFTVEFSSKAKDEIGKLANALNTSVGVLKNTIEPVRTAINELYGIATFLTKSEGEAAASGEEVSQSVEEVTNIISNQNTNIYYIAQKLAGFGDKLDKILNEIENIVISNDRIKETSSLGSSNLHNLVNSVEDVRVSFHASTKKIISLNDDVSKVNEITGVINNVAEQTNLLALNAAIESARAGEAGKGFSVVAEEIRKLAEQVMKSSKSINQLINSITFSAQDVVQGTVAITSKMDTQVGIIKETVTSFDGILAEINGTIAQMNGISVALKDIFEEKEEIVERVEEISAISAQVSESTQEISATMQNQSANMQQLSDLAQNLNDMADGLKEKINVFKTVK